MRHDSAIDSCFSQYDRLRDQSYYARYVEWFTLSKSDAQALLNYELRAVEATVMRALGQPVPAW